MPTTLTNHYFDDTHPLRPYTHSAPASPGTLPPANALRGEMPVARPGYHPAEANGGWTQIEDHRGMEGYLDGEPHTIKDFGPLPEGWSADPPPPAPEDQLTILTAAVRARLDAFAHTRDYDGIMSAATYVVDANPKFQAEGRCAVEARSRTWAKAYEIMDAVAAGERPAPSVEEFLAELPPLAWPEA